MIILSLEKLNLLFLSKRVRFNKFEFKDSKIKKLVKIKLIQINLILNFILNKTKHIKKNINIKNNEVLSPESKTIIEQSNVKIIKKIFWALDLFFLIMCKAKNKP